MNAVLIALYGVLGALLGSFLNVIIDRAPQRRSLDAVQRECADCERAYELKEMVPIVGYVVSKGRCPRCGAAISIRVPLVELVTGLLFAGTAWFRGWGFELAADSIYIGFLVVITVIDLEHHLILNRIIYPAWVVALAIAVLRVPLGAPRFLHYGYWQAANWSPALTNDLRAVASQLVGGAVAFAILMVIYLVSPSGMGDGDVRLAGLAGLMTGFPGALMAVFGTFLLGGLFGGLLLLTGRASRKTALPFAPFFCLAMFAVNLWGDGWLMVYLYG